MTKRIAIGLLVAGGLAGQTQVDLGRQVRNTLPYATGGTNATSQITARANVGTPDLVATDFPGADLGAQVNAAFASFGAGKCGTVAIPAGTFTYSTTIYVGSGCSLSGAGPGESTVSSGAKATRLVYTGAAATSAVAIMNPDESRADNASVRDLGISSGLSASCPSSGMLRWNAAAGGTNKWQCYNGTSFTAAVPQLAGIRHGSLNPTVLNDGTFIRIVNVAVDGSGTNWPSTYGAFHFGVMLNGCEECVLDQVRAGGADDGITVGPATNGVLLSQFTARFNKRSGLSAHFFDNMVCQHCLFESNGVSAPSSDPTLYGAGIRLADDDTGYGAGSHLVFIGTYFEANLVDVFVPAGQTGWLKLLKSVSGPSQLRGAFFDTIIETNDCTLIDPALITFSGNNIIDCPTNQPLSAAQTLFSGPVILTNNGNLRKIRAYASSGLIADFLEMPESNADRNLYIRTEGGSGTEGIRLENYRAASGGALTMPSAALWLSGNWWNGSASVKKSFYWQTLPQSDGTAILQVVGPDSTTLVNFYSDHRLGVPGALFSADGFQLVPVLRTNLGTPADGSLRYCSDCQQDATCSALGAGALAKRIAGAWKCN